MKKIRVIAFVFMLALLLTGFAFAEAAVTEPTVAGVVAPGDFELLDIDAVVMGLAPSPFVLSEQQEKSQEIAAMDMTELSLLIPGTIGTGAFFDSLGGVAVRLKYPSLVLAAI